MSDNTSNTSRTGGAIDPACTIDALIARHPESIFVLNAFGIDTCCGGSDSLEQAASYAHVDTNRLLAALEQAVSP